MTHQAREWSDARADHRFGGGQHLRRAAGPRSSRSTACGNGAGLGLTLARRLARTADGDVIAVPTTLGAVFRVTLPAGLIGQDEFRLAVPSVRCMAISSPLATQSRPALLNKVPEVTIFFWIIKILCTTVGETFADYVNSTLGFGLTTTTVMFSTALVVTISVQFRPAQVRSSGVLVDRRSRQRCRHVADRQSHRRPRCAARGSARQYSERRGSP